MPMSSKDKMLITGGHPLIGEISVSGGKNTAVAVIPAVLLADGPSTIENLPDIDDVHALIEILQMLGAKVDYVPDQYLTVDPRGAAGYHVPYKLTRRQRASYYLLGALLGRCGRAEVAYPGGCDIGTRPIDQHLKGFSALGAQIEDRGGMVYAHAGGLTGADIFFDMVTVGGTINVM
ncbi:MAG: UDP-N-acetylglucosamine 1-carboxyvinyltransferase, partial [Clostridia bacterium]|nr:UDP-N-acetylglucosamine 1-carboxyvinyltransferase [Clostridia bacterium]